MLKFLILTFLFLCDFISKKIIEYYIELNSFIEINSFLDLTHIHNYGISFGLFSGVIPSWVIIILAILVTLFVLFMILKTSDIVEKWGLNLIFIGAIANIFDRVLNNYVIDFIYINYQDFYWPAFNFADIYITIGILLIFIKVIWNPKNKRNKKI